MKRSFKGVSARQKLLMIVFIGFLFRLFMVNSDLRQVAGHVNMTGFIAKNLCEGRGFSFGLLELYWTRNNVHVLATEDTGFLRDFKLSEFPFDDIKRYFGEHANMIKEEDVYLPQAFYLPGYPVFACAIWKLTGERNYDVLRFIQILVDTAMIPLVFSIGNFFLSSGLVPAFMYSVYIPVVKFSTVPTKDIFLNWGIILLLYISIFVKSNSSRMSRLFISFSSLSFISAFIFMFRSEILLVFVGILFFLLFSLNRISLRERIILAFTSFISFFIFISPWVLRNYRVFGVPILSTTTFWHTFLASVWGDEGAEKKVEEFVGKDMLYGTPEYERYARELVLHLMRDDPGIFMGNILRRSIPSFLGFGLGNVHWGIEGFPYFSAFKKDTGLEGLRAYIEYARQYPFNFVIRVIERIWGITFIFLTVASFIKIRGREKYIFFIPFFILSAFFILVNFEYRYFILFHVAVIIPIGAFLQGLFIPSKTFLSTSRT